MSLFVGLTVQASNDTVQVSNSESSLESLNEKFDTMTDEQLNQYIDEVKESYTVKSQGRSTLSASTAKSSTNISAAWLAAAKLMENRGYPCAAKLTVNSVLNKNYSEAKVSPTGLFSAKIVKTTAFKNYLKKVKNNKAPAGIAFEKNDNADLFYSLHNTDATTKVNFPGTVIATYNVTITDTFDFSLNTDYKSLVTAIANNGAWLSQQTGALNKIKVSILFTQ